MIRNRLSELLAERGLKNARVARDIKSLSRNTINATTSNRGKMIQLETVNTLCRYLGIEPGEFFEYLPFDVDVSVNSDVPFSLPSNFEEEVNYIFSAFEYPGSFGLAPFYLNLYIEKQEGNQTTGIQKRVFELSAVMEDEIEFLVPDDNQKDMLEPEKKTIVFRIVLGDPPNNNSSQEREDFLNFWKNDLTPGFRKEVSITIKEKIDEYMEEIYKATPRIDWSNTGTLVLFGIDRKINSSIKSEPEISKDFRNWELPF